VRQPGNAHERCHAEVAEHLRESFGELVQAAESEPAFYVPLGRVGAAVAVVPIEGGSAVVDVYALILRELEVTPEVSAFLVRWAHGLRFICVSVDGDGDIVLKASLFAEAVTKAVLSRLVELTAAMADALEAALRERFPVLPTARG
jgi:hypothetical protein